MFVTDSLSAGEAAAIVIAALAFVVLMIGIYARRLVTGRYVGATPTGPVPPVWEPVVVFDVSAGVSGVAVRWPEVAQLAIGPDGARLTSDAFDTVWIDRHEVRRLRVRISVPPLPGRRTIRFDTADGRLAAVFVAGPQEVVDCLRDLGWPVVP